MQDQFDIPSGMRNYVSEYWGGNVTLGTNWQTWTKPRGVTLVSITAIGGGAGGGGACGAAAAGAAGGGGGGGSSGWSRALFLASMLPDVLFVSPGSGGTGGAGGTSGSGVNGVSGILSYVAVYPNTTIVAQNLLLKSGDAGAVFGGQGTAAAAGGTGAASTINTIATSPLAQMALSTQFLAGVVGTLGGIQTGGAGGAGVNNPTGCMILSGCGGGGKTASDQAGGGYAALANTLMTGSPGGVAGGNHGSNAFRLYRQPFWYGGTGGGASNSVTGGAGGSGGICPGVGGGGGGAGVTTGGRGGDGGPGLVTITSW